MFLREDTFYPNRVGEKKIEKKMNWNWLQEKEKQININWRGCIIQFSHGPWPSDSDFENQLACISMRLGRI